MQFQRHLLAISICSVIAQPALADLPSTAAVATAQLDTIQLQAHPLVQTAADFAVADHVVDQTQLATRATTIGDALADELGVYSNQFGAGSSRPVIRGQDGPRVKVLQHASETADVAALSPDHVVTVDPILAKQVEVIRGPSTLLYSAGTVGGLVNVTDQKIPTQMPENGLEGVVGVRYNSGNDQKLASGGVTAAVGEQFALRVEGTKHRANDYRAPNYVEIHPHDDHFHEEKKQRVPNTFSEGETVNIGGSWIHDRGFVGVSYSHREDQYGLPGHSHGDDEHDAGHGTGHTDHDDHAAHVADGAWIDLKSERYDVRTEWYTPFAGIEKLRAHASFTDYAHDELEGQEVFSNFKSKGYDGRVEFVHVPVAGWEGVFGAQFSQQNIDLTATEHAHDHGDDDATGHEHAGHDHDEHNHSVLMPNTKTQKWSVFALEHKQVGDVHLELGARADHQAIKVESAQKDVSDSAFSASAAANWEFAPQYKLSLVASHQQRLASAQELYAQGKHYASKTIEHGNPDLDAEKSNNLEIGLHFEGERFDYHVHAYHNWFDNYIYGQSQGYEEGFLELDYTQDKARFYGAEAQAGYTINDQYKLSVFADYVRGKIDNENAPRVPAGRLGTRVNADFADGWSGMAEYYHVFDQNEIAAYETATQGYDMVNLGVSYQRQLNNQNQYRVYLNANNLLDQTVYSHSSFISHIPQMGRNVTLGVQYQF